MTKSKLFALSIGVFLAGAVVGAVMAWPVFIGTYITKVQMPARPDSVPSSHVWAADASVGYWVGCTSVSPLEYECAVYEPEGKKLEDVVFGIDERALKDINPWINYYSSDEIQLDLRAARVSSN